MEKAGNKIAKVAGIYITRKCNLNCGYCNVHKKNMNELDIDQWIRALTIIENMGIEKVAILGGEPLIKPGINRLIYHLAHNTNLEFSITSNGTADLDKLKDIAEAGIKRFSCSIDTLEENSLDKFTTYKSKKAIQCFNLMQEYGVEHLTAYFVLSAKTLDQIVDLVKKLTNKKIWVYILPYHYGKEGEEFWETRDRIKKDNLAIEEKHLPLLKQQLEHLIDLKRKGYLISNSELYLKNIYSTVVGFKWHCPGDIRELRIDADGSLMCCHDFKGNLSSKFSIFDLERENVYQEFCKSREIDSKSCPGCIWPSQFHSNEYIENLDNIEGTFIKAANIK